MRILAVNAGSSTLKLSVVDDGDRVEAEQQTDGDADPIAALHDFVARAGAVDAVAHRLVHGGAAVRHATLVDDTVRHLLNGAVELAPLDVPPALALLDAARAQHRPAADRVRRHRVSCGDAGLRDHVRVAGSLARVGCTPLRVPRPFVRLVEPA